MGGGRGGGGGTDGVGGGVEGVGGGGGGGWSGPAQTDARLCRFQRSENRKKAPRRAQYNRPEVDPLAFCIENRVLLIFGGPKIRKRPRGERNRIDRRSIPLLFV